MLWSRILLEQHDYKNQETGGAALEYMNEILIHTGRDICTLSRCHSAGERHHFPLRSRYAQLLHAVFIANHDRPDIWLRTALSLDRTFQKLKIQGDARFHNPSPIMVLQNCLSRFQPVRGSDPTPSLLPQARAESRSWLTAGRIQRV